MGVERVGWRDSRGPARARGAIAASDRRPSEANDARNNGRHEVILARVQRSDRDDGDERETAESVRRLAVSSLRRLVVAVVSLLLDHQPTTVVGHVRPSSACGGPPSLASQAEAEAAPAGARRLGRHRLQVVSAVRRSSSSRRLRAAMVSSVAFPPTTATCIEGNHAQRCSDILNASN